MSKHIFLKALNFAITFMFLDKVIEDVEEANDVEDPEFFVQEGEELPDPLDLTDDQTTKVSSKYIFFIHYACQ